MKSITPTLNGLASSLFLNVGLTKLAEKLDPVAAHRGDVTHSRETSGGAQACIPSNFTVRPRR